MQRISGSSRQAKNSAIKRDPKQFLEMFCSLILVFIPLSMLISPMFDFFYIETRGESWTVTLSIFVFLLSSMSFYVLALFFLKSKNEKSYLWSMICFFVYSFLLTIYLADDLLYPMFGLLSALGSTLVGTLFYVSVRDKIISTINISYVLAFSSVLVVLPLILVHIDIEQFARLSEKFRASIILYGYENPRALGWISTICLSFLVAYVSTQPSRNGFQPIFFLLITLSAMTLFWSGSRGGLFAFVTSITLVLYFSATKNYRAISYVLICIFIGVSLSILLYLPTGQFGILSRLNHNLSQEDIDVVSSGRIDLWYTTILYIMDRPFLGYGFLPSKSLEGHTAGSAHNLILDSWLWFGLIVGTLFLLFWTTLWLKAFAFFRKADDHNISALFCVITTLSVYSMVSGPYARTLPLLLFGIASGVIFGVRASKEN